MCGPHHANAVGMPPITMVTNRQQQTMGPECDDFTGGTGGGEWRPVLGSTRPVRFGVDGLLPAMLGSLAFQLEFGLPLTTTGVFWLSL